VRVARAAVEGGAAWLGVTDVAEALQLRDAGIRAPILAWLHDADADFAAAAAADVDLGVSSVAQLERAADAGATVQLKVDTGLSRNGIPASRFAEAAGRAAELEEAGRLRVRGVFSHLANAGPEADARQRAAFDRALAEASDAGLRPELRHLAASEAAITEPASRYDLVRVGIAMYGLRPAAGLDLAAAGIRPAMRLEAEVAAVRRVPAGTGVSYGFIGSTERETTLALVPVGYADGVPRAASGRAEVQIAGRRHRGIGRIAMDQFVVDVGDAPVRVGDPVVLWGDGSDGEPTADEWAEWAGTIGYEIVTRLGARVPRRYLG
jgi:alanine racemase